MALCRPFRRNARACYMVGNAGHAHFFNFTRGGEFYYTFDQCISKHFFRTRAMSATISAARGYLPPIPAQHACWPHHGRCWEHAICFVLQGGGELCPLFIHLFKIELFPITGNIRHGLCLPPVTVCCLIRHNTRACHIMGNVWHG